MDNLNNRKFVGRLIFAVLTGRKNVREAIKLFPDIIKMYYKQKNKK